MGKLLDDTNATISSLNSSIENVMTNITSFKTLFDSTYMLRDFQDAAYLKGLLKEKLELGIRNNDNK